MIPHLAAQAQTQAQADNACEGLVAQFDSPAALLNAARRAHDAGFTKVEAIAPQSIDGLGRVLGRGGAWLPWLVLAIAACAGAGVYATLWAYALRQTLHSPLGAPFSGWLPFVPLSLEIIVYSIVTAAIVAAALQRTLTGPYQPLAAPRRLTANPAPCFLLMIDARDPRFDFQTTYEFLSSIPHLALQTLRSPD